MYVPSYFYCTNVCMYICTRSMYIICTMYEHVNKTGSPLSQETLPPTGWGWPTWVIFPFVGISTIESCWGWHWKVTGQQKEANLLLPLCFLFGWGHATLLHYIQTPTPSKRIWFCTSSQTARGVRMLHVEYLPTSLFEIRELRILIDRSLDSPPPHPHMGMWRGCTDGREEAASTDAWCTITTYPIQLGLGCHYEQHSRGRCASSSIDINRWYSVICVLDITTIINERRVEGGSHFVERRRRRRDVRTRSVAVTTISGNYLLPFDRYCRYAERSTIVTHIHIICSHTQGRLPHLIRIQATQT